MPLLTVGDSRWNILPPLFLEGFPGGSVLKNLLLSRRGALDPLVRKTHWRRQYSCLGNPSVRGAWWATVHRAAELNMTVFKHNKTFFRGVIPECSHPIYFPACWERLRAVGERGGRGWDDWMALSTQRTRIWANHGVWWRTAKPDVLQSMGSQRVRHVWVTEQQQS